MEVNSSLKYGGNYAILHGCYGIDKGLLWKKILQTCHHKGLIVKISLFLHQETTWMVSFSLVRIDDWSTKMKTYFISSGLWKIVTEGYEEPNPAKPLVVEKIMQLRRDLAARFLIKEGPSIDLFESIKNKKTAKEAWDFLHQEFGGELKNDGSTSALPEKLDNALEHDVAEVPGFMLHSVDPFYDLVLAKSHVYPSCCLHFPDNVYHLLPKQNLPAFVSCEGKTWAVEYRGAMKIRAFDVASWRIFALDNDLKIGDALLFELTATDDTKVEFKVHIIRSYIHPELQRLIKIRKAQCLMRKPQSRSQYKKLWKKKSH